ncbi:MAG TPA: Asp-tRNA(Asn)/Glu-tRNA(Gln) amidotransferase subunit GatC [Gemmatimonadales bacterium]|nr:Asp-tRNA(Asn)/Glu-tRNA(Gln) amidotransferase subunit GatC [Gemmatimonadales bacterium]
MSVTAKDVEHVARLAELAVEPGELPELTAQMDRIVGFVAQLGADRADEADEAVVERYVPGPEATPLREDVVRPADLAFPPAAIAPEFVEGFFVVPKLGPMEES